MFIEIIDKFKVKEFGEVGSTIIYSALGRVTPTLFKVILKPFAETTTGGDKVIF
jgi:hypothetical protein